MIDALVARPDRRASYTPALAAWLSPSSSALMMTTRSDAPYPSRSASSVIAVTLPPGSAGPPQPAPRGSRLGAGRAEVAAVGDVGLDRQDPGEAVGHQRSVHEQP